MEDQGVLRVGGGVMSIRINTRWDLGECPGEVWREVVPTAILRQCSACDPEETLFLRDSEQTSHGMAHAIDRLELALCGHQGPSVLQALSRLAMGDQLDDEDQAVLPVLGELGLGRQTATGFNLDSFGHKCADAAREYWLWVERGRRLHWEDSSPSLMLSNFTRKRVLEIGPGWGCNLFRLQQVTSHARGREIEEIYVRFTSIFAKMEGVDPPAIDIGSGEKLPYDEASIDWVLMFSTLQYLDIKSSLRDVARVLAPGGRLLTSQPMLPALVADPFRARREPLTLLHKCVTLANSLSYGLVGRRLLGNVTSKSTSRPVYLTRRQLVSIVEQAGLRFLPELSIQQEEAWEFVLVAEKPQR